jgi:hypothetical protein
MKTMSDLRKFMLFCMFGLAVLPVNAQITDPFHVFRVTAANVTTPIYQVSSNLFGLGFTSTSNINSQLTITNNSSSIPLIGLYRSGLYFYIDYLAGVVKFGSSTSSPALAIHSTNKNVFIGSPDYSFPSKLNILMNYSSTERTCIYNVINTNLSDDLASGIVFRINGAGANRTRAIDIANLSTGTQKTVFLVKGDGTTDIGGAYYSGTYGTAKLSVNGLIAAKEIVVNTSNWTDYVFDKDYPLLSLDAVEKYINENHHLPSIPSGTEIINNGYSVGEMDRLLLKKIEELTLYIIKLKDEINSLKKN